MNNYQIFKIGADTGQIYITSHKAKKMTQFQAEAVVKKILGFSAIAESGYEVYLCEDKSSILVLPTCKQYEVRRYYYGKEPAAPRLTS